MEGEKKDPSQIGKGPRVPLELLQAWKIALQQNRLGIRQSTHITNEGDEKISKLGAGGCAQRHQSACSRGLFGNVIVRR
jgi:hypothetical protein